MSFKQILTITFNVYLQVADKQTNLHNSGQSKIILGTKNGCCLLINSLTNEIEHKFVSLILFKSNFLLNFKFCL